MGNDERRLIVTSKNVIASSVVSIALRHESQAEKLPLWTPGAHIDVVLPEGVVRQYSLCGDPDDRAAFHIAVLREPQSRGGSAYIHDTLAVGDAVVVRGPRNNFPYVASNRYRFIAGGIGITPILPMIAKANEAGADWQLLYGGRTRASMAFLSQLGSYASRVTIAPQDETGLLDLERWLPYPENDCLVYCCGPEPLLTAIEARCEGWPGDVLRLERFKPLISEQANAEFEVELRRSGVTLTVPADKSIVQAIESAGIAASFSCLEGVCGTCETRVLEGIPDHRDSILSGKEKAENRTMMICVSRSCTKRLVLDL
jgi:ferredoxin-NADP reductase